MLPTTARAFWRSCSTDPAAFELLVSIPCRCRCERRLRGRNVVHELGRIAREMGFATPLDLAAIAALTHSHTAQGAKVRLLLPQRTVDEALAPFIVASAASSFSAGMMNAIGEGIARILKTSPGGQWAGDTLLICQFLQCVHRLLGASNKISLKVIRTKIQFFREAIRRQTEPFIFHSS